ncbi:hypothetical protein GCM10020331_088280 [Ectobacillus funiculus]
MMFPSEILATFNELEYSLYNYVIANGDKVIYMRIRDLADQAHVSTSTIFTLFAESCIAMDSQSLR